MEGNIRRRNFLRSIATVPALTASGILLQPSFVKAENIPDQNIPHKLKISLNAYSFNIPLKMAA